MSERTRTRTVSQPAQQTYSQYTWGGGSPVSTSKRSWATTTMLSETITDVGDQPRVYASKPVSHSYTYTVVTTPELIPISRDVTTPGSMWYTNEFGVRWDNGQPTISNLGWSSFVCPDIGSVPSGVLQEAFFQCLPRVGSDTSLINFLLELKDCRTLFDLFFTRMSKLRLASGLDLLRGKTRLRDLPLSDLKKVLLRRKNESFVDHLKRVGSSFVDETASNYLNVSFGWLPLISDLKSIWHALTTVNRRLQWLEKNQGKLLYRRYKKDLSSLVDLPQAYCLELAGGDTRTYSPSIWQPANFLNARPFNVESRVRWLDVPTLRATMLYRYTMPNIGPIAKKIAAYLDVFGVKPDATIVWNAIPFSFIADWFLDIGSFLRRNVSVENLGVKTEVVDFCYSLKSAAIAERRLVLPQFSDGVNTLPPAGCILRQQTKSRYQRRTGFPGVSASAFAKFGEREALLMSALTLTVGKGKRGRPRSVGSSIG